MSHITTLNLEIESRSYLEEALESMGYTIDKEATKIKGYGTQSAPADIVLNEHQSLGFRETEGGSMEFVGDFYDTGLDEGKFMSTLKSEYSKSMVTDLFAAQGINIMSEEVIEDTIEIRATY